MSIPRPSVTLDLTALTACTLVGDIHGCADELDDWLARFRESGAHAGGPIVFLGDLVNKGPDSLGVLTRVRALVDAGEAYALRGNHDQMLARVWAGSPAPRNPDGDTAHTLRQYAALPGTERAAWARWLLALPLRIDFDRGAAIAVHGGLPTEQEGGDLADADRAALWGSEGEARDGVPHGRLNWTLNYRGSTRVYQGHVPLHTVWRRGPVTSLDTGCVYGGRLAGLVYTTGELLAVPARRAYATKEGW